MSALTQEAFDCAPIAQLLVSPLSDEIVLANRKASQLVGSEIQALQRQPVTRLFAGCIPQLIVFTEEVLEKGIAWSDTLYLTHGEQQRRLESAATALRIGEHQLILLSLQDGELIERYRQHNEAQRYYRSGLGNWMRVSKVFQEFERENQLILSAAGEGIYGIDNQGRTTFVNPAAESMLGWRADELCGKKIHGLIHHHHADGRAYPESRCPIYASFSDGKIHQVDDEVFWTREGKPIDVEYTSTPIYDNSHLVGAVVIFHDVTEKKRDQRRLVEALHEVEELKQRLEMENAYLQEEINSTFNYHRIIGRSPAIHHVLNQVSMAAPTDVTVLITGESGTGKELIARAIHDSSQRKQRSLIRVNCAAIPSDLFESEFFGHVRGAFTGATQDRPGRFELADGGTLFLDEVAEIPLASQAKLLRVLQEQQFERVGGSKTQRVDVRIIAATNQNLTQRVEAGSFRQDLFFRLNVFPIESCPLRARFEDIPLLAQHFLKQASTKANKSGLRIPLSELAKLQAYHWPGNIRELENVIERAVILARQEILRFEDLPQQPVQSEICSQDSPWMTDAQQKDQQKQNLVAALRQSQGKVAGPGGAAELLNVPATTLYSRIKRYAIDVGACKSP